METVGEDEVAYWLVGGNVILRCLAKGVGTGGQPLQDTVGLAVRGDLAR